jgi:hypothetical protein
MLSKPFMLLFLAASFFAPVANAQAVLFKRYDRGAAYNRIVEDVLTLTIAVKPEQRPVVAVRVCSKRPLPFSLFTANAEPFLMAELLTGGYAYSPENVVFLRSEDCIGQDASRDVTELWTLKQRSALPPHVQKLAATEANRVELGKKPERRGGARDYRNAVHDLIKQLKLEPLASGVVFGYYHQKPSAAMKRRLSEVETIFKRSGLPPERYFVLTTRWNDETWEHDTEPNYPSVFIVKRLD